MINQEFQKIEKYILNTKYNVIIDAPAGAGKTTFGKYLSQKYPEKNIVRTAVTGTASTKINGTTISRLCGLQMYQFENHEIIEFSKNSDISEIDVLFIDEVGMFTLEQLEQVNIAFQSAHNNFSLPFGGTKVVMMGDQCQLDPIDIIDGEVIALSSVLEMSQKTRMGFKFIKTTLSINYRQSDHFSLFVLNKLRKTIKGEIPFNQELINFVYKRLDKNPYYEGSTIYSNSRDLPGDVFYSDHVYQPIGEAPYLSLTIEYGRQYLVTKNIYSGSGTYHNGETITLTEENIHKFLVRDYYHEKMQVLDKNGLPKIKTVQGAVKSEYLALTPMVSITTRRAQGATLPFGSLSREFFSPVNKVKITSQRGYLKTLYTALSRFEDLRKVSIAS